MATNNSCDEATAASGKVLQGQGVGTASAFSTATYPSVSGGNGKILYDNGTNFVESTPTFPASASATTRKIIVSDGTNWVASTETWATPGSSSNVLTSDGTNWTSAAAPSGNLQIATVTLTNSQIKNLHGTPIQIIAAPGSGKGIVVVTASGKFNYGGTNVFTAGAAQTIGLYYNNSTSSLLAGANYITNTTITSNANKFFTAGSGNISTFTNQAAGVLDNVNIAAFNSVATEISGNAANDNTIDIIVSYYIVTF